MNFNHVSIMPKQCIDALTIDPEGIYVDATVGAGGHSLLIAQRLNGGKLIALDKDDEAISAAKERLKAFKDSVIFIKSDYRNVKNALKSIDVNGIDGILFDIGVSSPQLDDKERGFSYSKDAPLDMRMDKSQSLDAGEIVNRWDVSSLSKIFYEYGEERYGLRIASAIAEARVVKPIKSTAELAELIIKAMPGKSRREEQHPAKRVFQAIRIAVNDELNALKEALTDAVEMLKPGGRIAVISFHSLEDRIVKNEFKRLSVGCVCPPDFPVCVCGGKPILKIITKKPATPDEDEIKSNPRARSAKLRVAEKI